MKRVRLEERNGFFCLVVIGTNRIVTRGKTKQECMAFLKNQREYGYSPNFKKGQHYAV